MDKHSPYYRQVALLLSALPVVALERCFALKGGTAINLFVRDFPRLSADIDFRRDYCLYRQKKASDILEAKRRGVKLNRNMI